MGKDNSASNRLINKKIIYKIAINFAFWLFGLIVTSIIFTFLKMNNIPYNPINVSDIWNFKVLGVMTLSFVIIFFIYSLFKHLSKDVKSDGVYDFFLDLTLNEFSDLLISFGSLTLVLTMSGGISKGYIFLGLILYVLGYFLCASRDETIQNLAS